MVVFTVNKVFYKKTRKVVYTVNKVAYRKHPFTTFGTESTIYGKRYPSVTTEMKSKVLNPWHS